MNRPAAHRIAALALAAGLAAGVSPRVARASEPTLFRLPGGFVGEEISADIERMYEQGLRYLMARQNPDGTWQNPNGQTGPAIDALCLMAFAAQGSDLRFGPHAAIVQRGLRTLLDRQDENGYIGPSMYHHGFATLALAELYGMVDEPRLGPALERAVNLILDAQNRSAMNAWRYAPASTDGDATVSGAQMVALFAARNAGIEVPEEAIEKGLDFYRRLQGMDGGIGYTSPGGGSPPRAAIAVLVASLANETDTRLFQGAWSWLRSQGGSAGGASSYLFYHLYYAAQAYFRADMNAWREWNRATLEGLRPSQNALGGWDGPQGSVFCTASTLLVAALNYRYLPIYER